MMRIGLALSGGGLRATLYHLGVIRYLKQSGVLPSVTHITSVSGGSILGAHLVLNWDRYNGSQEELDEVCREILDFVRLDIRNRIVRRYPFALTYGAMQRIARQRPGRHSTRTGLLESQYRESLFGDTCLHQLPVRPELHILCTNLSEGVLSSFTRSGLLLEDRTGAEPTGMRRLRAGLATVPMAVAASSAFPGFFPPLELTAEDIGATEGEFQTLYFTDGGVYDNLGVRMFRYLERRQESELRVDELQCEETAVEVWNAALRSTSSTSLRRIAQLCEVGSGSGNGSGNGNGNGTRSNGGAHYANSSKDLVGGLERLIRDGNLIKDRELRELLGIGRQNGNGNGNGNGHSFPSSKSGDRFAKNRQLVSLAFQEAAGREVLTPPGAGFDTIIASDAGKKFQVTRPDRAGSFLRTAMRSSDILMDRVWQLEKHHFENASEFIFAPITRIVDQDEDPTALHPEIQVQVSKIRTDMDRFTEDEVSGLVQHGYCVARQSLAKAECCETYRCDDQPWDPVQRSGETRRTNEKGTPLRKASADESTQRARRLMRSSRRKYLATLFAFNDWISYLYVPIAILIFVIAPYLMYRSWRHGHVASTLTAAIAETRDDYKTLLSLMEYGTVDGWQGMPFEDAEKLNPLFAEQGLDIIADSRIVDLRRFDDYTRDGKSWAYVYRSVSVRKTSHGDGPTGLQLQSLWDMPAIQARCHNPNLNPKLYRCLVDTDAGETPRYSWQLELDFSSVPVGHTTDVLVEALLPVENPSVNGYGRPWWQFEVDADPEVATSWLLLPENWEARNAQLVRFENSLRESVELVEPTHRATMSDGAILHWIIVHPKAGCTYSYRWNARR